MFSAKRILFLAIGLAAFTSLNAQNNRGSILTSYERQFIRAGLKEKVQVLHDASTDEDSKEFMGSLYDFALKFSLENVGLLRDDPDMLNLVNTVVSGLGLDMYVPAIDNLWQIFLIYRDNVIRIEVLKTLAAISKDDALAVDKINQFLADQNKLFDSGVSPDYLILRALVSSLKTIGSERSLGVLFRTMLIPYREDVGAQETFFSIQGDKQSFFKEVILNGASQEKLAALRLVTSGELFTSEQLGEFAETGLEAGLAMDSAGENAAGMELRRISIEIIGRIKWVKALPLVSKHFYLVERAYRNDPALKKDFLDTIGCLTALESADAAQILSLQLGLFNSRIELNPNDNSLDVSVVMALIEALGDLGDKSAFEYLSYVRFLSYPDSVKAAAQSAIDRLKR